MSGVNNRTLYIMESTQALLHNSCLEILYTSGIKLPGLDMASKHHADG